MAKRDFYETLGVSKSASDAELKSAFRKAAMQCHPDRHPGDKQAEARFKELNEAYQHLSDAQKRAAYDRYGHAAFDQSGMSDGFAVSPISARHRGVSKRHSRPLHAADFISFKASSCRRRLRGIPRR